MALHRIASFDLLQLNKVLLLAVLMASFIALASGNHRRWHYQPPSPPVGYNRPPPPPPPYYPVAAEPDYDEVQNYEFKYGVNGITMAI